MAPVALSFALIAYACVLRFPQLTPFEMSRRLLGPWLGGAINLLAVLFLLFHVAISVRLFAEIFVVTVMPETPLPALSVLILLLAVPTALSGFPLIARISEFLLPVLLAGRIALPLMLIRHMDPYRILPVFEFGPVPMLMKSIAPIGILGELAWVLLLASGHLRQAKPAFRSALVATALLVSAVSLMAATLLLVLGPRLLQLEVFPVYTLTRRSSLPSFSAALNG